MRYPDAVWAHFRSPRHAGELGEADGTGESGTPAARARLRLQLQWQDGVVTRAAFQALGCPCTIAAGSWLAEHATGRPLQELRALAVPQVEEQLGLPAIKRHCAVMAVEALERALECATTEQQ